MKKPACLISLTWVAFSLLVTALTCAKPAHAVEVAFEEDHDLPIVYLNVALKAGSVNDPAREHGITNFMGEMLLRGTRSRSKEQIDLALDQMGARLEIETRAEATILRGAVLSSQLDSFLRLITELVTESNFPDREIRKLRSEMISGLLEEQGDDPALASKRFTRFLFGDHPYGNPVLGNLKDIARLTRADVLSQYNELVTDKNLLIVGTGDASQARIQEWARELARHRPAGAKVATATLPAPRNSSERRLLLVDKPDRTQTQINIGQIGVLMTDKDFFPLYLGNYAFGGGSFSARLMVEIRVKRGWSYGAGSSFRFGTEPRSWHAHLFPASKDAAPALATTLRLIEDLSRSGITQDEFSFAQRSLVNSAGFMYNTPQKRVENILLERTLDLPDGFMKSYGPELSKVTLPEVNASLRTFLKPGQLAIEVLCTASELKGPLIKAAGISPKQVVVQPYTQD